MVNVKTFGVMKMNNEELRKKVFIKILDENTAYTQDFIEGADFGLQACWQLFMPHIEILPEGSTPMIGDYMHDNQTGLEITRCELEKPWYTQFDYKIIARNGKPCIKAKDLMREYA